MKDNSKYITIFIANLDLEPLFGGYCRIEANSGSVYACYFSIDKRSFTEVIAKVQPRAAGVAHFVEKVR